MLALLQHGWPQVLDLALVTTAVGGATLVVARQVLGLGRGKKGCSSGCGSCPTAHPPSELVQIRRHKPLRK